MHAISPITMPSLQSIYVLQAGVYLGPYTEKEVRRHWANGTISDADLLWQEGMSEWVSLRSYFGIPSPMITESSTGRIPSTAPLRPMTASQLVFKEPPTYGYQGHPAAAASWLVLASWTCFGASILAAAVFYQKPMWVGLVAGFSAVVALIHVIRLRSVSSIWLLIAILSVPALVWCLAVALLPPPAPEAPSDPVETIQPAQTPTMGN
jgi:hypothetical protein